MSITIEKSKEILANLNKMDLGAAEMIETTPFEEYDMVFQAAISSNRAVKNVVITTMRHLERTVENYHDLEFYVLLRKIINKIELVESRMVNGPVVFKLYDKNKSLESPEDPKEE
jgi:hypothetical protein